MKRLRLALLFLLAPWLASASGTAPLRVVTLHTVLTELSREVGGTHVTVTPLLRPGIDPHHFEPSPADVARRFYYDSLVYNAALLEQQIALFGATQTMIGTDYPFIILDKDPQGRIDALSVDDATKTLLRRDNARRWLGLDV